MTTDRLSHKVVRTRMHTSNVSRETQAHTHTRVTRMHHTQDFGGLPNNGCAAAPVLFRPGYAIETGQFFRPKDPHLLRADNHQASGGSLRPISL